MTMKQQDALTDHFNKKASEHSHETVRINRTKAGWTFKGILKDYTFKEAMALVDFYFDSFNHKTHDFAYFSYNYDQLDALKAERDEEKKHIDKLRVESAARAKEWAEKRGHRTQDDRSDPS